jgi:hypothetical protein
MSASLEGSNACRIPVMAAFGETKRDIKKSNIGANIMK